MPFFGNVCFIKFGPFSALLALPVMIREEYGQMTHQTLPNILLSNASLVTKSCIARFVDDDASNSNSVQSLDQVSVGNRFSLFAQRPNRQQDIGKRRNPGFHNIFICGIFAGEAV